MVKRLMAAAALAGALLFSAAANAAVIDVVFSSAPNRFGSPSWSPYVANALNSLENNLGNVGDRTTDPTAYEQLTSFFAPSDLVVTGDNSWRGQFGPTLPFQNELGNRMHAGLHAVSDVRFSLSQVTFFFGSNDAANNFFGPSCISGTGGSLCFEGNLAGLNFAERAVGIDYVDGIKGNGNDIVYNSGNVGSDAVLINELMYVGIGNAFEGTGGQAAIDNAIDFINDEISILRAGYCLGTQACGEDLIHQVPEPFSVAFLMIGAAALGFTARRRRQTS